MEGRQEMCWPPPPWPPSLCPGLQGTESRVDPGMVPGQLLPRLVLSCGQRARLWCGEEGNHALYGSWHAHISEWSKAF